MESRNEPQSTDTHNEHHHTLPTIQTSGITTIRRWTPRSIQAFGEFATDKIGRYYPCQQCRNTQIGREACSRHRSITPQYQTYRVANDSKATTTACCHDYCRTNIHALTGILQDVMHDDQHHRRCRQVVQIS